MAVSFSQNIAPHSAISTVGLEGMASLQGQYRNEAVQQLSHQTAMQHPQSFAALVGSQMMSLRRETNLKDLVDRMRQNPKLISTAQSSFSVVIAEMPPQDQEILESVARFLSGLQGQAQVMRSRREGAGAGHPVDEFAELPAPPAPLGRHEDHGGGVAREQSGFEGMILDSVRGMQSMEGKRAMLAVARGYFDGLDEVDLEFLNALNRLAAQYDQLVDPLLAEQPSQPPTMETNPLGVRREFRRKLRETADLGLLLRELAELGIEVKLLEDVGRDLSSLTGAEDGRYVASLTRELSRLWQIRSVQEECRDLVSQIKAHLGRRQPPPDAIGLAVSMLSFCSKASVTQNDAQQLMAAVSAAPLQGQVVFANSLKDLHARLPEGIWPSGKDRFVQYSGLRVLCDRLAEAEEKAVAEAARVRRQGRR